MTATNQTYGVTLNARHASGGNRSLGTEAINEIEIRPGGVKDHADGSMEIFPPNLRVMLSVGGFDRWNNVFLTIDIGKVLAQVVRKDNSATKWLVLWMASQIRDRKVSDELIDLINDATQPWLTERLQEEIRLRNEQEAALSAEIDMATAMAEFADGKD